MPREKPGFRGNMERLNERYPDHDMLTIQECMVVNGWKSVNTAKKHIGHLINKKSHKISKTDLAIYMSA